MAERGNGRERGNGEGRRFEDGRTPGTKNTTGGPVPVESLPMVHLRQELEAIGQAGLVPGDTPDNTRLQEILDRCSPDQMRYIAIRPFVRYDKDAAKQLGFSQASIPHWKNIDEIREAIAIVSRQAVTAAQVLLQTFALKASLELVSELDSKRVTVRHNAAKEILNRGGLPAMQRMEFGNDRSRDALLTPDERLLALLALVQRAQPEGAGEG
jgi:hypothetical protein